MTDTSEQLRIIHGPPLESGKMYLRLYHGRHTPDEELHDWGFDGLCLARSPPW